MLFELIIFSMFTNESGYFLSSIPHNVSMKFTVRRIKCSRELFEGFAISPQATGKQLSASRSLPFIQANEVKRTEILASGISTN